MIYHSKRLIFEKFQAADFDLYFQLASNKKVMHHITGKTIPEKDAQIRYQAILDHNTIHQNLGYFKVNLQSDHSYIGLGKLEFKQTEEAELGYSILPAYWRKGYGSEISAWLVEKALTIPSLHQLMAIIDPENIASEKILRQQKFTLTETKNMNGLPAAFYHLQL